MSHTGCATVKYIESSLSDHGEEKDESQYTVNTRPSGPNIFWLGTWGFQFEIILMSLDSGQDSCTMMVNFFIWKQSAYLVDANTRYENWLAYFCVFQVTG